MRTKPHATYIPPSKDEMREVAKRVELKAYSIELANDLANLASGGKICLPSEYVGKVTQEVQATLKADSSGDYQTYNLFEFKNSSYTKDRAKGERCAIAHRINYHQKVCDFLQTIDLQRMEGNTPLEKAMFCLKMLSDSKGSSGSGEGDSLPIFTDSDTTPEAVANEMHETLDKIDNLSDVEKQMLDPENKVFYESGGKEKNSLAKLQVAKDLQKNSQKEIMLRISRLLDNFTKLQTSKSIKEIADPAGNETRQRPMQDISELARLGGTDWAMYKANKSYFMYQAVTGQMNINERITKEERKQAIFILVDGSGSMNGTRHYKATGVVMNRLKAVLKGDAVCYISVFDTEMQKPDFAENQEQATKLIKKFADGNYSGGGTDIAKAVISAHNFIKNEIAEGKLLYRPEIIVLTDDDSSANGVKSSQIAGTRVHGFAMESKNPNLKTLAESTGGLYFDNF
jgi:Mg-chelatase subunit ChlD